MKSRPRGIEELDLDIKELDHAYRHVAEVQHLHPSQEAKYYGQIGHRNAEGLCDPGDGHLERGVGCFSSYLCRFPLHMCFTRLLAAMAS